ITFCFFFFFSSRRRHTRFSRDWSSDVCSSDLRQVTGPEELVARIGGDEFVALLRDADALTARGVADEIIAAIAREHRLADGRSEIGRASCRERVEMAVGAGTLEEKIKSDEDSG